MLTFSTIQIILLILEVEVLELRFFRGNCSGTGRLVVALEHLIPRVLIPNSLDCNSHNSGLEFLELQSTLSEGDAEVEIVQLWAHISSIFFECY